MSTALAAQQSALQYEITPVERKDCLLALTLHKTIRRRYYPELGRW